MNGTPEEFRRALLLVFGDAVSSDVEGVSLSVDGVCLHFALTNQAPTKIGALQLAVLRVEISVRHGDEAAVEKLLARVDRATLRGGG